jgi:hypothetical protein
MPDEFDFIIIQSKHPCGQCLYQFGEGDLWYLEDDTCCNRDWSGGPACEPGTENTGEEDCVCPCADDYPDSGTNDGCEGASFPSNPQPYSDHIVQCGPDVPSVGHCKDDDDQTNVRKCGESCVTSDCSGLCWWKWECEFTGDEFTEECGDPNGLTPECTWIWQTGHHNSDPCSDDLRNWVLQEECQPGSAGHACEAHLRPTCRCTGKPESAPPLEDPSKPCQPADNPFSNASQQGFCKHRPITEGWVLQRTEGNCHESASDGAHCVCDLATVPSITDPTGGVEYSTNCKGNDCCEDGIAPYDCHICFPSTSICGKL